MSGITLKKIQVLNNSYNTNYRLSWNQISRIDYDIHRVRNKTQFPKLKKYKFLTLILKENIKLDQITNGKYLSPQEHIKRVKIPLNLALPLKSKLVKILSQYVKIQDNSERN